MDRRLGDPVHVDELRFAISMAIKPRGERLGLKRLASEDHEPQRELVDVDVPNLIGPNQLAERRGGLVQDGDRFIPEQAEKVFR